MVVYGQNAGNRTIMGGWWNLGKAVFEASQLWWWRVTVFVLLPIIMILRWTHAVTGWPFTALNLMYMAAFAGVLIVALARFSQGHNQRGSPWSWRRPVRIRIPATGDQSFGDVAGHRLPSAVVLRRCPPRYRRQNSYPPILRWHRSKFFLLHGRQHLI